MMKLNEQNPFVLAAGESSHASNIYLDPVPGADTLPKLFDIAHSDGRSAEFLVVSLPAGQ